MAFRRAAETGLIADESEAGTQQRTRAQTVELSLATIPRRASRIPSTILERLLFIFSRYREASIAAVAVVLVVYFQIGSHGQFIETQFLGVVLRDTGRSVDRRR